MNNNILSYDNVPSLVQIETTYACNHKCAFCYNPKREQTVNLEKLDKIVDSISKSQVPHVYLIGGEPSLVPVEKLNEYIEKLSIYSSVAIVTNGSIRLENLTHKLACFGIPIHGMNAKEHDESTRVQGSYDRTISNIKYYVSHGFDVRVVLVLTGYNYNHMYEMIKMAGELGAESVYVDRYEDGGLGASVSKQLTLKPTLVQFREGVKQIIKAKNELAIFKGKIGFGTAIPMCIDENLIKHNMTSTCGVGTTFCAVNPEGELRVCNQSEIKFGNVIEEPIEIIWEKRELNLYRDLSWVEEPCKSCKLLEECQCGCKVDVNCSEQFCIDFAVREGRDEITDENIRKINEGYYNDFLYGEKEIDESYPEEMRVFKLNSYLKIHEKYKRKKIVTKYKTIDIKGIALEIVKAIVNGSIVNEKELIERYQDLIEVSELRKFISGLIEAEALDLIGVS